MGTVVGVRPTSALNGGGLGTGWMNRVALQSGTGEATMTGTSSQNLVMSSWVNDKGASINGLPEGATIVGFQFDVTLATQAGQTGTVNVRTATFFAGEVSIDIDPIGPSAEYGMNPVVVTWGGPTETFGIDASDLALIGEQLELVVLTVSVTSAMSDTHDLGPAVFTIYFQEAPGDEGVGRQWRSRQRRPLWGVR